MIPGLLQMMQGGHWRKVEAPSDNDIEKVVSEAETGDRGQKRARLKHIYSVEKSLTEHADVFDEETKTEVNRVLAEAKEDQESEDTELTKAKAETLNQASKKIGLAIYKDKPSAFEGDARKENEVKEDTEEADFDKKKDDNHKTENKK